MLAVAGREKTGSPLLERSCTSITALHVAGHYKGKMKTICKRQSVFSRFFTLSKDYTPFFNGSGVSRAHRTPGMGH